MGSLNICSGSVLQCSFPRVLSASLSDKLSGERTLEFSVLASRSQSLSVGMTAEAGQAVLQHRADFQANHRRISCDYRAMRTHLLYFE